MPPLNRLRANQLLWGEVVFLSKGVDLQLSETLPERNLPCLGPSRSRNPITEWLRLHRLLRFSGPNRFAGEKNALPHIESWTVLSYPNGRVLVVPNISYGILIIQNSTKKNVQRHVEYLLALCGHDGIDPQFGITDLCCESPKIH